ncbi:MAG: hypothetical protein ACREQN_17140 [Candidatus Binataceae bacterium]
MLLKVALVLAMGSLGMLLMWRPSESQEAAVLEREVTAQLQALREYLFAR